jgi:hypothetical protein
VNGTNYSGTVGAGNTFSIAVAGSDLAADTSFDVSVSGSDDAGNPFTATTTSTHSIDTTIPSLNITSSQSTLGPNGLAQLTFTFSEVVTGFTLGDIVVAGGAVSNLVQDSMDPKIWRADFTADGNDISISVANGSYQDIAGNSGNGNNLDINVNPDANNDIIKISATTPTILKSAGLLGELYNTNNQLDGAGFPGNSVLAEVQSIIDNQTPNATFVSTSINYDVGSGDLGQGNNFANWIGPDASSIEYNNQTSSSDAIVRFSGYMSFTEGDNRFRIRADDGYIFRVKIDGVWVDTAVQDVNQAPTTTTHGVFSIPSDGVYEIEVIYWDQGGQYELEVEIGLDTGSGFSYQVVGGDLLSNIVITPNELLANDTDVDGPGNLSIIAVSNAVGGTVEIANDGNIVFKIDAGYSGPLSFDYTISDGAGGTDTASVQLKYDVPTLDIENGYGNNLTGTIIEGSLVDMGYDGGGSITLSDSLLPNDLTANGDTINWEVNGNVLSGFVVRGGLPVTILDITANPTNGTYQLQIYEPIDQDFDLFDVDLRGNGSNQANLYINESEQLTTSSANQVVHITANNGSGLVSRTNSGIGVGSNQISTGESILMTFIGSVFQVDIDFQGSRQTYSYTVQYKDGTSASGSDNSSGSNPLNIADIGKEIESIEITGINRVNGGSSNFYIRDVQFEQAINDPLNLDLPFTATDADGDPVVGQFEVVLTHTELNLSDLSGEAGVFVMETDNDTLLIDSASLSNFSGKIEGGEGIDTIKFNESGLDLTGSELHDHFGSGFEIIDLDDGGNNTINLTLETVKELSSGSEWSVTDTNNNTYDNVLRIVGGDELGETDTINTDTTWTQVGTTSGGSTLYQLGPDAATAPIVELVDIPPTQIVEV